MAKKFLTPIDLSQLELQNARIQNLASAPSSPVKGQIYFNTTTNKAMVYNGTTWVPWEADTNTVTGVKGNSETNYRTGNVNITAANVGAAPTNHASTATTYGIGTDSNYGHVKLSDATNSTSSTSSGIAATPKAVKDALVSAVAYSDTLEEALGSAAYKNAATSISSTSDNSSVPTSKTVYDYVGSAISAADALRFKGTIGTGGTVTTLPTSGVKVGDTYRVITAGTYAGQVCEIGDLIIAIATTPTWTVAQTNIDGAVIATDTTTNGYLAKFTGDKVVANGPQLGSSTTTFLRNDGSWATPPTVTTTSNGLATPAMLLAIQDIPTDDTLTITAGQTSVSTNHTVRSYIAYDASTYEEIVVDLEYGANSRTFSIASAYTNDIKILIWG